ncbi:MAG: GIY-YIG nuclease family protein [Pseudomonadota bacterium]
MYYFVYILATGRNGTFYVGVTNDLLRRIWEHRNGLAEGFTKKYDVHRLVYYELHTDIEHAIRREKSIKRWSRVMKMEAIERMNPDWEDLYHDIAQ